VLLAEAGLLAGCQATIHRAYVASLSRYPDVRVRAERSLVVTGAGDRIVMGGGGTSWQNMALYLIARHVGLTEARQVARTYTLDWHDHGQLPFASLLIAKQMNDALIAQRKPWSDHPRSGRRRLVLRPAVRQRFLPKPGPANGVWTRGLVNCSSPKSHAVLCEESARIGVLLR
jgi:hypothetical protein